MSSEIKPADHQAIVTKYGQRVRGAITAISLVSAPQIRAVLDLYPNLINPAFAIDGHTRLPKTPHYHGKERSSDFGQINTLYFHCGNAIMGYWELCRETKTAGRIEHRVKILEDIAAAGDKWPKKFPVQGSEQDGFSLLPVPETVAKQYKPLTDAEYAALTTPEEIK